MTIQIELLNKDQHRSVTVSYRDGTVNEKGEKDGGFTVSLAGVIHPQESNSFWIHSNRELLIEENEYKQTSGKP